MQEWLKYLKSKKKKAVSKNAWLNVSKTMLAYLKSFCFDRPVFVTYDLIENAIFAYVLQGFCAVLLKQRAQVLLADRCTNQDFAHANVSKISKTIQTYLNVSKI